MAARQKQAKPTTCRMFETPFIEWFSHIHPATPFVFWLPVLAGMGWWSLARGMSVPVLLGLALSGWLAWTLTEYLLHRHIFHAIGPKPWQRRFHFVFHGVHHDFPQDASRLVMPLGVSIPIGLGFYLLMICAVGGLYASALLVGYGLGYLGYDGIHYFTHHLPARTPLGKFLKRYHMVHHHTGVEGMWGVSQPLWDYVFRTTESRRARVGAGSS